MEKRLLFPIVVLIALLSGCTSPAKEPNPNPQRASTAPQYEHQPTIDNSDAANYAVENDDTAAIMNMAFGETIRTDGAITPDVQYNGAGKVIAYYREYKDGTDFDPTSERWDFSFLPDNLVAENPEDVFAIAVVDMSAFVVGLTTNPDEVGDLVDQIIRYEVSLYDPLSWRRVFIGYFFGESAPIGSYTIAWDSLTPPDKYEVVEYIESMTKQQETIPVSTSWQSLDSALASFVVDHFDFYDGEWEAYGEHFHSQELNIEYSHSGKLAGCFFDSNDRRLYWTDSIIPTELRADSPEDVMSVIVVNRNTAINAITVYFVNLRGDSLSCRGIASLSENQYNSFSSQINAIKECVFSLGLLAVEPDDSGPFIEFVEYRNLTPAKMTVVMQNIAPFEYELLYFYPDTIWLERLEEGQWKQVPEFPVSDRWALRITESFIVGSVESFSLDWDEKYGVLPSGQYRVGFTLRGEKLPSSHQAVRFYEDFEIEFSLS